MSRTRDLASGLRDVPSNPGAAQAQEVDEDSGKQAISDHHQE